MSSSEACDNSCEDSNQDEPSEDSSEDERDSLESNADSHEVRVEVLHKIHSHMNDIPLKVSMDPEAYEIISHFREEGFMPKESILQYDEEYDEEGEPSHWSVYHVYKTENYNVEVRAYNVDNDYYYDVKVQHVNAKIINNGHVYSSQDVVTICNLLKNNEFKPAMEILFSRYGGGAKDQQTRSTELLEWIVGESEFRTTISGVDL